MKERDEQQAAKPVTAVDSSRMPHLPALDGLRGLAVIGALLFHGGFAWAGGGFLGVSTFFVLSGFLITSLLLREWEHTGSIRLGPFWARRFRRLLPAALLTLSLIALLWWRIGSAEQLAKLRWDLIAAVAYVANWRFYFDGTSYGELFSAPSPLLHFWSLAIEEQYYLLFPPAVMAMMAIGGRRLLLALLCVATVVSIGLGFWLGSDIDRIYYGTDTRAAELLAGALLAIWWSAAPRPSPNSIASAAGATAGRKLADLAGVLALAAMFWAWWSVTMTSSVLRYGGLPLYALLTIMIIQAAIRPGPLARLLSWPPLRWTGLISYGLYLYHWPVFLILDEQRIGWRPVPLFALQIAVTTAIALASYYLLEMPVRRGQLLKSNKAAGAAGLAGAAVVAICAVLVTLNPPRSTIAYADVRLNDFSKTLEAGQPADAAATGELSSGTPTGTGAVMIVGDSGTVDASPALRAVFEAAGARPVLEKAYPGIGLSNPQLKWRQAYKKLVRKNQPELIIMMLGGWDVEYVEEQGEDAYAALVNDAARILTARGAKLLWLSMLPGGTTPERPVNAVYQKLAQRFPGKVAYTDIESSLRAPADARLAVTMQGSESWPRSYTDTHGNTVLLRKPDFWHLCPTGAERLATAIHSAAAAQGWAEPAQAGWQMGNWRNDPRYNNPEGGCVAE